MAIPNFITSSTLVYDTSSPISLTVPLPVHQADDILIVVGYMSNNGEMSITEGWTQIANRTGTIRRATWWWKRAIDSETPDPVITADVYSCYAIAHIIRNCTTIGTPYENATLVGDLTSQTDLTPDSAEIDTLGADRLVACFLTIDDNVTWNIPPPPTEWTLENDQLTGEGQDCRLTVISYEKATAGTVASVVVGTFSTYEKWVTLTLAFKPEEIITKTFEESGSGVETLLADKILLLIETGNGIDKWVLPEVTFITFSDSGNGIENLLVNKILSPFEDSGSGVESWIANKLREFVDSGVGIDVFLRDWTPIFTDVGSGVEAYYKVFHYPANLKRVIILIRDRK